ncbi:hypothetical protein B0H14DRAFT_2581572 [Mycena olivaceomarginata]|nr:hypothetical protein B0H14DRAFT_2581572 [Mycena olivaceomarginata]
MPVKSMSGKRAMSPAPCLRELWDKAVKIGFEFGEERAARTKKEGFEEGRMARIRDALEKWKGVNAAAAERREKDLEEERMWGFEVGWRLCEEENKVRSAVSVETAEPADIVLDPDDILPTPMTRSVETQTDAPVAAVPPLDWAEDAGDLPVHPFPTPQPLAARDFSLRSGGAQVKQGTSAKCNVRPPHWELPNWEAVENSRSRLNPYPLVEGQKYGFAQRGKGFGNSQNQLKLLNMGT